MASAGQTGFGLSSRHWAEHDERSAAHASPQRFFTSALAFAQSTPRMQSAHAVSVTHAFTTAPPDTWMHFRQLSDRIAPLFELPPVAGVPPAPGVPPVAGVPPEPPVPLPEVQSPHMPAPASTPAPPEVPLPALATAPPFPLAGLPELPVPAAPPVDVPAWALAPALPPELPSEPPHELRTRTTVPSGPTARFHIAILSSGARNPGLISSRRNRSQQRDCQPGAAKTMAPMNASAIGKCGAACRAGSGASRRSTIARNAVGATPTTARLLPRRAADNTAVARSSLGGHRASLVVTRKLERCPPRRQASPRPGEWPLQIVEDLGQPDAQWVPVTRVRALVCEHRFARAVVEAGPEHEKREDDKTSSRSTALLSPVSPPCRHHAFELVDQLGIDSFDRVHQSGHGRQRSVAQDARDDVLRSRLRHGFPPCNRLVGKGPPDALAAHQRFFAQPIEHLGDRGVDEPPRLAHDAVHVGPGSNAQVPQG
jgi:hypothetical protein